MPAIKGINDSNLSKKWSQLSSNQKSKLKAVHGDNAKSAFKAAKTAAQSHSSKSSPKPSPKPSSSPSPFKSKSPYGGAYSSAKPSPKPSSSGGSSSKSSGGSSGGFSKTIKPGNSGKSWAQKGSKGKAKAIEKYGSKQAWYQAKSVASSHSPIGSTNPTGTGKSTGNALHDQYGTGLAGYANWWNAEGKQKAIDSEAEYRKNNPNSGLNKFDDWHDISVGENGLLDWNGTMPVNSLDIAKMKEFGIKGGDQIFDPQKYNDINGDTTNGMLDAHYFAQDIAMPLRDGAGYHKDHNLQMQRNEWEANADGTKLLDASHLFKDKYRVGYHSGDDQGDDFVGSMHWENPAQAINENRKKPGDIKAGIARYVADGGYAGDVLKYINGSYKDTLKSEADIKWYNGLVKQAENFDWTRTNEAASRSAGGDYNVWEGGLAAQYQSGGSGAGMAAASGGTGSNWVMPTTSGSSGRGGGGSSSGGFSNPWDSAPQTTTMPSASDLYNLRNPMEYIREFRERMGATGQNVNYNFDSNQFINNYRNNSTSSSQFYQGMKM